MAAIKGTMRQSTQGIMVLGIDANDPLVKAAPVNVNQLNCAQIVPVARTVVDLNRYVAMFALGLLEEFDELG